ncbi:MAG: transposase [Kofleriaceae bacterium]
MRQARLHVPGLVHHLIWRFVDRRWFIESSEHREEYLRWLGRALLETDWRCIAYALMSNHIHLAVVAGNEPLATWSRRVNVPFAKWINEHYARIGPVFANRANDWATADGKVAGVIAYIHNNPVRAFVVERARDSDWTSHGAYLAGQGPRWLHVDEGLARANHDSKSFDAFVEGHPPDPDRPNPKKLTRAVEHYGQINVATPFDRQIPLVIRPFGRIRPDPHRVVELVCAALGQHPSEVASRRRKYSLRQARVAIVHCGLAVGLTGADVGAVLGVTQQAVSWIARNRTRPQELCERVFDQLRREVRMELVL